MSAISDAIVAGCWLNGWLAGRESADETIAGLTGAHPSVRFLLPAEAPLAPALFLGQLRANAVKRVRVVLPVPGDPLGLAGPASFNADAIEAGEALLLEGPGLGLVPDRDGAELRWLGAPAETPAYFPDVAEADRELREAVRRTADELAALDVAAWNPDVADALLNLRRPVPSDDRITFASAAAARTAVNGLRCREIVRLAARDDGGALTAGPAGRRREALSALDRAARAAVAAACSTVDGR